MCSVKNSKSIEQKENYSDLFFIFENELQRIRKTLEALYIWRKVKINLKIDSWKYLRIDENSLSTRVIWCLTTDIQSDLPILERDRTSIWNFVNFVRWKKTFQTFRIFMTLFLKNSNFHRIFTKIFLSTHFPQHYTDSVFSRSKIIFNRWLNPVVLGAK